MLREGLEQIAASYATSGLAAGGQPARPSADAIGRADGAGGASGAPRLWRAGCAGRRREAWRIADDVLRCTTERQVPQAQAVAAVTAAIMAQLDGEREVVLKLAGEALHVRRRGQHAAVAAVGPSLQWWAGEGIEEPELPGPVARGPTSRCCWPTTRWRASSGAGALLDDALETSPCDR